MYKMIIADDEPSTRQGIRTAVNWSLLDIEIVAEAANGGRKHWIWCGHSIQIS